jgi:Zn-dependent peptidase ImmA (M78 family)
MRATRWIDDSDADQVRAEWEANWFAAELLMPRKAFKAAVDRNGLSYAADLFNVSISAAKVRAKSI